MFGSRARLVHIPFSVAAALVLVVITVSPILMWRTAEPGITLSAPQWIVQQVQPGLPADTAGFRVGDQVLSVDGEPIDRMLVRMRDFDSLQVPTSPIEFRVRRNGVVETLTYQPHLSVSSQSFKLLMLTAALVAWISSVVLFRARNRQSGLVLVSTFWLGTSLIVGTVILGALGWQLLYVLQMWVMTALLLPLMALMHFRYPRNLAAHSRWARFVSLSVVGATISLNAWLAFRATSIGTPIVGVASDLNALLPVMMLFVLGLSATTLYYAYRQASSAHSRRQLRLLFSGLIVVLVSWLGLLVVPQLVFDTTPIRGRWLMAAFCLLSLAYVVGGTVSDLYHLDKVVAHNSLLLLAVVLSFVLSAAVARMVANTASTMTLVTAVIFAGCCVPVSDHWLRFVSSRHERRRATAFSTGVRELAATFEIPQAVAIVYQTLATTFGVPALALYVYDAEEPERLRLVVDERLAPLPETLTRVLLPAHARSSGVVLDATSLPTVLGAMALGEADRAAYGRTDIALWCMCHDPAGTLLAAVALGWRTDLDPYRPDDYVELERFMSELSLALTRAATFHDAVHANHELTELHLHTETIRQETETRIAQQLHDDGIGVFVRANLRELDELLERVETPEVRHALERLIEGERSIEELLRLACEELHPFGIDFPDGLPALLRNYLTNAQKHFAGTCSLVIEEDRLVPIDPVIQYQVYKIMSEAVENAVQHADATQITVTVRYPYEEKAPIVLTVQDNGCNAALLVDKPYHHGLRNMRQRSTVIGARLTFQVEPDQSTAVVLSFSPCLPSAAITVSRNVPRFVGETLRTPSLRSTVDHRPSTSYPRTA